MTGPEIRRAGPADVDGVAAIHARMVAEQPDVFHAELVPPPGWHLDRGRVCLLAPGSTTSPAGVVSAVDHAGAVTFAGLWVAASHRRRGVASALLDAVDDWAASQRASLVTCWVAVTNPARELYEQRGMVVTGAPVSVPGRPGHRELRYARLLS